MSSKNPGCKMLFRTEEEEDRPNAASQVRRSQPRSPISITSSPLLSSIPCQDEEEDKSGLFKRVIMRIAKTISTITDQNKRRRLDEDFLNSSPQQLEAGGSPDLFSPSFWELMYQNLLHPSFPPRNAQIPGTITLPCGENQQVREVNPLDGEPAD
jgi:hypothetical protein